MRVLPPNSSIGTSHATVNGRTYTCALGSSLDVPDFDGNALVANGWITIGNRGAGTTVQRLALTNVKKGDTWMDSTLGYVVIFDGAAWRNPNDATSV